VELLKLSKGLKVIHFEADIQYDHTNRKMGILSTFNKSAQVV